MARDCEIRFSPSYLVIITQVKFFLAGVSSFSSQRQADGELMASLIIFATLTGYVWKLRPCTVSIINHWLTAGFFWLTFASFCSLITLASEESGVMSIVLILFTVLEFIVLVAFTVRHSMTLEEIKPDYDARVADVSRMAPRDRASALQSYNSVPVIDDPSKKHEPGSHVEGSIPLGVKLRNNKPGRLSLRRSSRKSDYEDDGSPSLRNSRNRNLTSKNGFTAVNIVDVKIEEK